MMVARKMDLWGLVWGKPEIDPKALTLAVENELGREGQDFRTRLLVRDSMNVLADYWGSERWRQWLERSPYRARIDAIQREDLGEPKFHLAKEQLVEPTDPEVIKQFLRDLGAQVAKKLKLYVGGAGSLILSGYLSRATGDIDVVDEVPAEIRARRDLLAELKQQYRLELAHFQSHYLPSGWQNRLQWLGVFGNLEVFTIDASDIFLCKLFSKRAKDLTDLRTLAPQLDKATLDRRLAETTASFRADASLVQQAERNWYIVFGESLPS